MTTWQETKQRVLKRIDGEFFAEVCVIILALFLIGSLFVGVVDRIRTKAELATLRETVAALRMDNERLRRIEAGLNDEIHRLRTRGDTP